MTPTQRRAMEMAHEALETELRGYFGPSPRLTVVIEAIRAALAEQADDKADMTIKLPPMPEPDHKFVDLEGEEPDIPVWNQASLEAYAREAVRLNIAAERELQRLGGAQQGIEDDGTNRTLRMAAGQ